MTQYISYIAIVILMILLYKAAKLFMFVTLEIFEDSSEWFKISSIVIILIFASIFMWKLLEALRITFAGIIS